MNNRCPPRNRPWSAGSRVQRTNHKAMGSDRAPPILTVYIGHTIGVTGHILIRIHGINLIILYSVWFRQIYFSVFGGETIIYDNGSKDISNTFKLLYFVQKMRKYPSDVSVSENYIDANWEMVERRNPDNFNRFPL